MNKGMKLFGKPGHEAIIKEMKQLHNLKVMEPRNLSNDDKKAAADYLMFLKEKGTRPSKLADALIAANNALKYPKKDQARRQ